MNEQQAKQLSQLTSESPQEGERRTIYCMGCEQDTPHKFVSGTLDYWECEEKDCRLRFVVNAWPFG